MSAQTATVRMTSGATTVFNFTAPTTVPTLNATAPVQVVTTSSASGTKFFAGEVDDSFYFDLPAFNRFVASVSAGSPNPAGFTRARDTFAGYNVLAISLRLPKSLVPNANGSVGVSAATFRTPNALANVSTRANVQGGANVLIAGSIIGGNLPKRLIVRALGPTLAAPPFNVPGTLSDPTLKLFNGNGALLASNDNWHDRQAAEISSSGFAPPDPRESAIIATVNPGNYTAVVDGAGGAKGVALVEVYDLNNMPQVDRLGLPIINAALVPFARKDEYNAASPASDAAGLFAGDIVATLHALGTDDIHVSIIRSIAVDRGDILRLNLNLANSGNGGGNNGAAAFPNGRRLADDVIDTLLTLINNGNSLGDNVNANDVAALNTFPFFALSQQPRENVIDDNTRN